MNILFLTQIVPFPPDAGPKVKTYHVLRALAEQGHSITLVSFVRSEEMSQIAGLSTLCAEIHSVPLQRSRLADAWYLIRSYLTKRPFMVERDDLSPMQRLVNRLVRERRFDVIHADQLTMVQFGLRGAAACSPGKKPRVIFDAHNAVWTIVERVQHNMPWFLKPVVGIEARRLKHYEGELLKKVDHVLAVTQIDADYLKQALPSANGKHRGRVSPITVVPIAVDTRHIYPIHRSPHSNHIVTLGTLHYPPNADGIRWFLTDLFPIIRQHIPTAALTVIGKNPPPDFLSAEARHPESIRVTGYVPELVSFFEKSAVMVVPVRAGGGMRVRILEAFAYGMPVVTTTVGLEGIDAVPGEDVLVADSSQDFARTVVELLENSLLQQKLSVNGRRLAETKYDWQVALAPMKTLYDV